MDLPCASERFSVYTVSKEGGAGNVAFFYEYTANMWGNDVSHELLATNSVNVNLNF